MRRLTGDALGRRGGCSVLMHGRGDAQRAVLCEDKKARGSYSPGPRRQVHCPLEVIGFLRADFETVAG